MDFWSNFKYAIKIDDNKYVTEVSYSPKTFRCDSLDEIRSKNLKILSFKLREAVDLMNSIYCNGYQVSMEPYNE